MSVIYRYIVGNIYRYIIGDIYRYIIGDIYRGGGGERAKPPTLSRKRGTKSPVILVYCDKFTNLKICVLYWYVIICC